MRQKKHQFTIHEHYFLNHNSRPYHIFELKDNGVTIEKASYAATGNYPEQDNVITQFYKRAGDIIKRMQEEERDGETG